MAIVKIFEGGNLSNRTSHRMFPSGTSPAACNPPYSYADHQRSRIYGVTRRIDLRNRAPYGGSTSNGGKDQSLRDFFANNPPSAGDDLQTHLLLPNTVLLAVSYGILSATPGFQFDIVAAGVTVANNVTTTTVPVNATGCPLAVYVPVTNPAAYSIAGAGFFIADESFVHLHIDTLPTAGFTPATGTTGLNMWITAHVLDLDHGNA